MSFNMLGHNQTQMDSYNKNTPQAHGTLIANWYEERMHRDMKGEGRALTKTHLPKKHELLMTGQTAFNIKQDDTKFRVIGQRTQPIGKSQNYGQIYDNDRYGKGYSKADSLPRTGKKQQLLQQMYLASIHSSLAQTQQIQQSQARKGDFRTTHQTSFTPKPLTENVVGRLIMYDQDGRNVSLDRVDEDLREGCKFIERGQITSDQQLKKLVDTDIGYERQEPITFWKEKVQDGTFYHSKPEGISPFAKNNEFLKTFQHYKHYKD